MSRWKSLSAGAALVLAFAAPVEAGETLVIRMAGGAEPPSPAAELRALLNGVERAPELKLEIVEGAAAERSLKAALRRGEADVAAIPLWTLARESGIFAFDRIPYLATSRSEARRLFDAASTPISQRLLEDDLVLLAVEPRPAVGLLTRMRIDRAAHLAGKRLWSPDAALRRFAEIAGAIAEPEASQADALFVEAAAAASYVRARTLSPGRWTFIRLEGWHQARAVTISAKRLASLSPEIAQRLTSGGPSATAQWWRDEALGSEAARRSLADAGVEIEPPSSELTADFARFGRQMASEWVPGAGADGAKLIGAFPGTEHPR